MPTPLRTTIWMLLASAVVWQGAAGTASVLAEAWSTRDAGFAARFLGTGDDRLLRDLGDDFAVVRALRRAARPGELALCRFEPTPEAFVEGTGSAARLTRLRHALFPSPMLTQAGPAPIELAEAAIGPGQSVLLVTFAGEPTPDGRERWAVVERGEAFSVWRLVGP